MPRNVDKRWGIPLSTDNRRAWFDNVLLELRAIPSWCVLQGCSLDFAQRNSLAYDYRQRRQILTRVARVAVLWPNSTHLAAFPFGWPSDFWVGRFHGRLGETVFCWSFLKICLYFKAKLSKTAPFFKVTSLVCAFRLAYWKRDSVSVRFTCRILQTVQTKPLYAYVSLFMAVIACKRP